jgi:hypothetical protein
VTRRPRRTRGQNGQGALEVLAAVPLVVIAALVAWQLVAVIGAGLAATERARAQAMEHRTGHGVARFEQRVAVPRVLPIGSGLTVSARAAVRRP